MKNKIYYLEIACCTLILTGCLFKINHWPTASIQITIGIVVFAFVFLPSAMISSYRSEDNKRYKWQYLAAFVCSFLPIVGALVKINHWPGTHWLFIVSMPICFVVFLPIYLYHNRVDKQINYSNFLVILFFLAYFAVISSMLALNVSRDMISETQVAAIDFQKKAIQINVQTKLLIEANTDSSSKVKLQAIQNQSNALISLIDTFESELIISTPQNSKTSLLNIRTIPNKDFSGSGVEFVERGQRATKLKTEIDTYRKSLLARLNASDSATMKFIQYQLNTTTPNGVKWENARFYGRNLIAVVEELENLKMKVALATYNAVTTNIISTMQASVTK